MTCASLQIYLNEIKFRSSKVTIPNYLAKDISEIIKETQFSGSIEDWIIDLIKKRIKKG